MKPAHLALAGVDESYATPSSTPWGIDTPKNTAPVPFGNTDDGQFYDVQDEKVGGTDSVFAPDWSSRGDNAPAVNSGSGLGGERTAFGPVLGASALAEGKF